MPSFLADTNERMPYPPGGPVKSPSYGGSPAPALVNGDGPRTNGVYTNGASAPANNKHAYLNGRSSISSTSDRSPPTMNGRPDPPAANGVNGDAHTNGAHADAPRGRQSSIDTRRSQADSMEYGSRHTGRDDGYFASHQNGVLEDACLTSSVNVKLGEGIPSLDGTASRLSQQPSPPEPGDNPRQSLQSNQTVSETTLRVPDSRHRLSSPPAFGHDRAGPSSMAGRPGAQLQHRHTLEVPKAASASRSSRELGNDEVVSATGRFSPNAPTRRRGSMNTTKRTSRSIQSELHLDDAPLDEEALRWAEQIRQKRQSKRKRKDDEDDDRVVVGTKVDQNHVNWVTAYNMLTGIRFTVSRTNAKMDRELTDLDFDAKHKFSFDITGNELTPSAKYDFKFKDYAPWVFRHLRNTFKLDPADYLMSLTSKYILSELGSPGKSGSFFYFSRDYKYIIKTIHHAEHKFLRKILKDYYNHVQDNPNTLLSQFYGLHRVKMPYGKKIHFVVMNNLFPPHRDIHRTFDLKGSTIGRDFKEDDLEKNPRATLKDLNWLRRNLHLEFGPEKRRMFTEQMERDVKLLQKLKIMDYSLLVGIHDLERGNEENLRDKTLQVFQPNGEEESLPNPLTRTPSKLENARKAKELRQVIKNQRPIPMDQSTNKMPDEVQEGRKCFYFYSDDGGFQATHENNAPGEEIYYLGIIDCLTHYSFVKRSEHFFKGLMNNESQISAIPPERYGDRFVRFISGITKTRERAELEKAEKVFNDPQLTGVNLQHTATSEVMEKAEHEAEKTVRRGASEDDVPDRSIVAVRSPSVERGKETGGAILPIVEEAGESSSVGGRSGRSQERGSPHLNPAQRAHDGGPQRPPPTPPKDGTNEERPPTPPKDDGYRMAPANPPPTPPKDARPIRLPTRPMVAQELVSSPNAIKPVDMETVATRVSRVN